jgi:hypothetical protein
MLIWSGVGDWFSENPVFIDEVKSPERVVGLPQNSHTLVIQDSLSLHGVVVVFFLYLSVHRYLESVELLVVLVGFENLSCVNWAAKLV